MTKFKREYTRYICQKESAFVMPKLRYYEDEEGALVVQLASSWKSGNASLYFAFEKDEDESSFGMVWNDDLKKNFESRSAFGFLKESSMFFRFCIQTRNGLH